MNIITLSGNKFTVDRQAVATSTPRVIEFTFGDGYTQRLNKGLNVLKQEFTVSLVNRPVEEITFLTDFLSSLGGAAPFGFSFPGAPRALSTVNFSGTTIARTAGDTFSGLGIPDYVLVDGGVNSRYYTVNKTATNNANTITIYGATLSTVSGVATTIYAGIGVVCASWEEVVVQPSVRSLRMTLQREYAP